MTREYVHQELGTEVAVPAGYYTLLKELRLTHDGREVLCITGVGMVESSCCAGDNIIAGRGGYYALVPGYVVSWKSGKTGTGAPTTEVESIIDIGARQHIARMIAETEGIRNVEFWHAPVHSANDDRSREIRSKS